MMLGVLIPVVLSVTSNVTPVEKVVNMLEDLEQQVINEGKKEAETYDKFACFCKDTAAEKTTAITTGEKMKTTLEATLNEAQVTRENEQQNKQDAGTIVATLKQEIKKERATRRAAHNTYAETILDLEKAIQASQEAEKLIQASNTGPALVHMKKTVRRALLLAEALGAKITTALLDQPFDPETEDYSFHSGEVLSILKDLHKKFVEDKNAADEKEITGKKAHDELLQGKRDEQLIQETAAEKAEKEVQAKTKLIGETQAQLTEISAKLLDDQAYLQELTNNCNSKAATWQQRSTARSGELSALHQAAMIIKDQVATIGKAPASPPTETLTLIAKTEPPTFVQLSVSEVPVSRHGRFLAARSILSRVAELLRSKSAHMKHASLLKFAARVAENDPFDKVKTLVQELIDRLLKEAASEQDHHNWCTGETQKAKQTRKTKAEEIREFNAQLAKGEAHRDQLKEDSATLKIELADLAKALEDAQAVRDQENAEFQQSVKDADTGRDAVAEAIKILKDYYESAKANVVSLVSQAPPDSGFKNDEAYGGSQGTANGVLGMLDVIRSDFVRQKSTAEADEKEALTIFNEFKSSSNASVAAKEKQQETKKEDLSAQESENQLNMDGLTGSQKLFDGAVTELLMLHEECVATGQSHEERAAARQEEIAALKEALCIIDKEGPVQSGNC
eukprot:GEMP01018479.1.p1 GENE.GEMP01018479.1~~GEMP01018479.1.p1  ORF type:complete len:680 (+),score=237.03 GEMP01018479.1:82-2121(+)